MIPQGFQIQSLPAGAPAMAVKGSSAVAGSGAKDGNSFMSTLQRVGRAAQTHGNGAGVQGDSGGFNVSGGNDLVKKIETLLGRSGVTGGGKTMDQDLLDALEQFLLGLGFDAGEVGKLMGKLVESADGGEVSLTDLLAGLGELGEIGLEDEEDEEEMLAISAHPFLESILAGYGLTPEQVEGVLSKASGKSGISIPKLVSSLQEIQLEQANEGPASSERSMGFENQLADLMKRIGISGEKENGEPLSFDDFINELGKMIQTGEESGNSGTQAGAELSKILAGLDAGGTSGKEAGAGMVLEPGERKGADLRARAKRKENPVAMKAGEKAEAKDGTMADASASDLEKLRGIKGMGEEKAQVGVEPKVVSESAEASTEIPKAGDGTQALAEGRTAEAKAGDVIARPPSEKRGLPAYVMNQVSRQLVRSSAEGESELQIQIKPPRLGRLQMTIDNSSDGLKVSIIAEHQAARDMLLAHSSELKATLAEQGMRVDSIDVELSRNFDQTLADTRRDQEGGKRRGGKSGGSMGDAGGEDLSALGIARAERLDNGDLDLVA